MVALAIPLSIYTAIRDPFVQSFATRTVAGMLSEKLGTKIFIRNFFFDIDLTLSLQDVVVNDLKGRPLLLADHINLGLFWSDFAHEIHLNSLTLDGIQMNIVRYENEDELNLQFLIDFFSGQADTAIVSEEPSAFALKLDKLLIRDTEFRYWDQNQDSPGQVGMDYNHLLISDINMLARKVEMHGDTIEADISRLSASDTCGLQLVSFAAGLKVTPQFTHITDAKFSTEKSEINLDVKFDYNGYTAFYDFVDSVRMQAILKPSNLYLAEIGYFAPILFSMKNRVSLAGNVEGFVRDFKASTLSFSFGNATDFLGSIEMVGLPDFYSTRIDMNIQKMNASIADLSGFELPDEMGKLPVPQEISALGNLSIKGIFKGFYNDFLAQASLHTPHGSITTDLIVRSNPINNQISYQGRLLSKKLSIGKLLSDESTFGLLSMDVKLKGKGISVKDAMFNIDGKISEVGFKGNVFKDIVLAGDYTNQQFNGKVLIDDEKLNFDFDGKVDFSTSKPVFDFLADIKHADLYKLNLLENDTIMQVQCKVHANVSGVKPDDIVGELRIDSALFIDSRGTYSMQQFSLNVQRDSLIPINLQLNTDFLSLEVGGQIDFAIIGKSFTDFVRHYVPLLGAESGETLTIPEQDFYVTLHIKNTETLTRLFMPSLHVAEGSSLNGVFTTRDYSLNATFRSNELRYGEMRFEKVFLKTASNDQMAKVDFNLSQIVFRDSTSIDTTVLGIDRPHFGVSLRNDSILMDVKWKDQLAVSRNRGDIIASFVPMRSDSAELKINHADILVNDSIVKISPDNLIRITNNYTSITNLNIGIGNQSLRLNGHVPLNESDSLDIIFGDWNISNFDLITQGYGFDLDGIISGDLQLANLRNRPAFFSNLTVNKLRLNNEKLGDARLLSSWSNSDESIYLNAQIINVGNVSTSKMLGLSGFYFPNRADDNLLFSLKLDNFRIKAIGPFLEGLLSKIEGLASGEFNLTGSLNKPVLTGKLNLMRTAFRIDYLNTVYSLQHDFEFENNLISFNDLVLYDTLGNKAEVSGNITHDYLRNFIFNIQIDPDNFLALNTTRAQNELFFGTAIMSGNVSIKGPIENIGLNITATTNKGTSMVIPFDGASSVSDNEYVIFIQNEQEKQEEAIALQTKKSSQAFNINLNTYVTPDANLKIFLPYNMGNLESRGSGNIRMGANSNGDFTLAGDYIVEKGQFNFVFENLVRKRFDLLEGGRISWTGDPYDANIDVSGLYKVKTSVSSLGIVLDTTTSLRNRVNVECIIHLTNQLFNPDIKFSIRLPNVDDDTRQRVFAVLDTTNDAMMTQQMISLLVLGSFSYTGGSNASLSSSYINVLSNQLSNWLSQISKDFDIGLHYKPGDELTNNELEVALSTQLFNDRVSIDGNFGMIDSRSTAQNASNIVGDVDISVKITQDGRLRAKAFNHSNINSLYYNSAFDNYAPYTQGIGLSYRQEFDRFGDLFMRKKKKINKNTTIP